MRVLRDHEVAAVRPSPRRKLSISSGKAWLKLVSRRTWLQWFGLVLVSPEVRCHWPICVLLKAALRWK